MAFVIEEARVEQERRRQELENRMERLIRSAPEDVIEILEALVAATQANEEIRRKRASGDAEALDDDKLTCFVGGRVDEEGPNVRPADREACGERLRRLQQKSKIQAKFWGRELNLLEFLAGHWE